MDPTVTVAILGAVGTVTSPIVAEFVKHRLAQRKMPTIASNRLEALQGKWEGTIHQEDSPKGPLDGTLTIVFSVARKEVMGKAEQTIAWGSERLQQSFGLSGAFYHSRFLNLTYSSTLASAVHFGTFLLEFSDAGDELTGRFLSYGPKSERIVCGTVILRRAHH